MQRAPRTLALLVLLALPLTTARAQLSGGLKAGMSVFSISGDSRVDFTPHTGLGAGVWLRAPLPGRFGLQAEVNYLTKGANAEGRVGDIYPNEGNPDTPIRFRLTHTYLEVPLLLAWTPPEIGRVTPRLYAGPHVSLLQDAYLRYGLRDEALGDADRDESVRSRDYGVTVGAHAAFNAGSFGDLVAGAQLSAGLGNIRNAKPAFHSNGIFVFIGFAF